MAGAQEVIMIFRCQDVSLALCVLMCTFKTLQLTASALGEQERKQAGEGEEKADSPSPHLLLANKWGEMTKSWKTSPQRSGVSLWRGDEPERVPQIGGGLRAHQEAGALAHLSPTWPGV